MVELQTLSTTEREVYGLIAPLADPEIPVLTLTDLGIIRDIKDKKGKIEIHITPTYSGCPAMNLITMQIKAVLEEAGFDNYEILEQLSPAWTTDWMTEEGKKKLKEYGIAPPTEAIGKMGLMTGESSLQCPHCNSENTEMVSQFSGTSCKALFKCNDCKEPFEYFKCH